jgi:hypothetical protein
MNERLLIAMAGLAAGYAAREVLARPQTQRQVRQAMRHVSPEAQAVVERWLTRGHEVMVREGERQLIVFCRVAGGEVRRVVLRKIVDLDATEGA